MSNSGVSAGANLPLPPEANVAPPVAALLNGMSAGPSDPRDTNTRVVDRGKINGPLVGLLSGHAGGLRAMKLQKQRVYYSSLETAVKMHGKTSISVAPIVHKVEKVRIDSANLCGDYRDAGGFAINQEFLLNSTVAEEADKRIDSRRGNAAVSANFTRNDHSALVARLMAAVGRYSQTGKMTFEMLSANRLEVLTVTRLTDVLKKAVIAFMYHVSLLSMVKVMLGTRLLVLC